MKKPEHSRKYTTLRLTCSIALDGLVVVALLEVRVAALLLRSRLHNFSQGYFHLDIYHERFTFFLLIFFFYSPICNVLERYTHYKSLFCTYFITLKFNPILKLALNKPMPNCKSPLPIHRTKLIFVYKLVSANSYQTTCKKFQCLYCIC